MKKVIPKTLIDNLVSVQPMGGPVGMMMYMDFKYGCRVFWMWEELWLEDSEDEEYYCPQISEDSYMNEKEFLEMRERCLLFPDWEIKQMESVERYQAPKKKIWLMSDELTVVYRGGIATMSKEFIKI